MSEFTANTKKPFPNTIADLSTLRTISEWTEERLENKVVEYWQFKERTNIMPRAIAAADKMLEHLGFEIDYRSGFYAAEEAA